MAGMVLEHANSTKRSFDQAILPDFQLHHHLVRHVVTFDSLSHPEYTVSSSSPTKRRSVSFSRASSMLVDGTAHAMPGSFPSFMSVYEDTTVTSVYRDVSIDDQSKLDQHALNFANPKTSHTDTHVPPKPLAHRGSIHSLMSDSTDSSPSTTYSTFDSPIISDSSPSSSPESATSLAPLTSFQSVMLSTNPRHVAALATQKPNQPQPASNTPNPLPESGRNVKNLTLDMSASTLRRSVTENVPGSFQPFSAPTSPLKEPLKTSRKKPTNLSIRTPGFQSVSFATAMNGVPPTPSLHRPTLQPFVSSPSISSFASPTFAPAGGMHLPLPPSIHSKQSSLSNHNYGSSYGSSLIASSLPDLREEETQQVPKSQETPERGYTEGPVRIYDSGVFLYLEPTAEEASEFDTVINVAKEIKNPFRNRKPEDKTVMSVWRAEPGQDKSHVPEPQTAVSEVSFKSALEWPKAKQIPSPTTPTQSSFDQKSKQPEYFHVPWDHNSEIIEDLYALCHLIDARVQMRRKVLIHCQLGVSRSASLIIAYGLFKGYQNDFHSMYTAVKERSKWVGPNMSLIYQLMEYQSKVSKGEFPESSKIPKPDWLQRATDGGSTPTAETAALQHAAAVNDASVEANAAIQPSASSPLSRKSTPLRLNKALPPVPLFSKSAMHSDQPTSTSQNPEQTSPSIAPTTIKRAASRPLPLRERSPQMAIQEHRFRQLPSLQLTRPSSIMDLAMNDVPETPSLFSPRATEFVASPFGIRGAGDLSVPGSRKSQCAPSTFDWLPLRRDKHFRTASKDPRSPHQKDEPKGIFRTIDGFL